MTEPYGPCDDCCDTSSESDGGAFPIGQGSSKQVDDIMFFLFSEGAADQPTQPCKWSVSRLWPKH